MTQGRHGKLLNQDTVCIVLETSSIPLQPGPVCFSSATWHSGPKPTTVTGMKQWPRIGDRKVSLLPGYELFPSPCQEESRDASSDVWASALPQSFESGSRLTVRPRLPRFSRGGAVVAGMVLRSDLICLFGVLNFPFSFSRAGFMQYCS